MQNSETERKNTRIGLILLTFVAFIALGMPDGLMGVGWPSIRAGFGLPLDALGMLLIAGTTGYMFSSFISGRMISWLGIGGLLAASCGITGLALLGYTLVPVWGMMVALGFFSGLGAGGIDAGLNTYVAAHFGEGLMQWLHASFGVGVTLGPLIMTYALEHFTSWRLGYVVVGIVQLTLSVTFLLTLTRWKENGAAKDEEEQLLTDYKTPYGETFKQPAVWLSILIFFLYTGIEVALGLWAYTYLTEALGIAPQTAGFWTGSYWAMFTIGRILAGLYTSRIGNHLLVWVNLLMAFLGSTLLWWNPSQMITLLGIGIIGFAIAPLFPAFVSGTKARVGAKFAANTIGMQIAAAGLGAAMIPGLVGILARRISLNIIPVSIFVLFAVLLMIYFLAGQMEVRRKGVPLKEQSIPAEK